MRQGAGLEYPEHQAAELAGGGCAAEFGVVLRRRAVVDHDELWIFLLLEVAETERKRVESLKGRLSSAAHGVSCAGLGRGFAPHHLRAEKVRETFGVVQRVLADFADDRGLLSRVGNRRKFRTLRLRRGRGDTQRRGAIAQHVERFTGLRSDTDGEQLFDLAVGEFVGEFDVLEVLGDVVIGSLQLDAGAEKTEQLLDRERLGRRDEAKYKRGTKDTDSHGYIFP